MKRYQRQKWIALAALTLGSVAQLSTCRQEASLFGLRTLFTSFTLPINELLQALIFAFA